MAAILAGLDALVFCGGIGEHAWRIRQRICQDFEWLGIELYETRNQAGEMVISRERSRVRIPRHSNRRREHDCPPQRAPACSCPFSGDAPIQLPHGAEVPRFRPVF